jgi:hypothetical protein
MVYAIQERLNDEHDPMEHRYVLAPEKITEGGMVFLDYPGRDPGNKRGYKSLRHWLQNESGKDLSPYPWPLVGISPTALRSAEARELERILSDEALEKAKREELGLGEEEELTMNHMSLYPWTKLGLDHLEAREDWILNGEGVPLIPEGTRGKTCLLARWRAPVWTMGEVKTIADVMTTKYDIKCTKFPSPIVLTF